MASTPVMHSSTSRSWASPSIAPGATPSPVTLKRSPSGSRMRRMVSSLTVRVPVLSEQMKVQEPSASTAISLRMMTRHLAIRRMPIASATVSAAGRPSGMVETARPIAIITMSREL